MLNTFIELKLAINKVIIDIYRDLEITTSEDTILKELSSILNIFYKPIVKI